MALLHKIRMFFDRRYFDRVNAEIAAENEVIRLRTIALFHNIPYEYRDFWPPVYITFKNPHRSGLKVSGQIYDAKIGDVVPVFYSDDTAHLYKLVGFSWASGDDHIVSPKQFHIVYQGFDDSIRLGSTTS